MTLLEYRDRVLCIETANPNEPLLPLLRNGLSAVNAIYLRAAEKRLQCPEKNEQGDTIDDAVLPDDSVEDAKWANDNTWRAMTADIARAYNAIRAERNNYLRCTNDEQRGKVVDSVESCWANIQAAIAKRRYYEESGLDAPVDDAEMPRSAFESAKRLNSVRAQISQMKRNIEEAIREDKDASKMEGKLQKLMREKGLLEQAVKTGESA